VAMETNCWGSSPALGYSGKCNNSDNFTALGNLAEGATLNTIDIDGDGANDTLYSHDRWKLQHLGTEAVWNRSLALTVRIKRCSNLSFDNATSSSDSDFDNIPISLKDLCLAAVNGDGAITKFDDAMSALTEGPFVNWSLQMDNGSSRIPVTGTQPWEKTYKLLLADGTAVQYPSNSWWAGDPRATDNTTFPGKWAVAHFLQEVVWPVSQWNPTGPTASQITPRCQFFTATDNISTYCAQMPTYIEARTVLPNILENRQTNIASFVNTNDSRIIKRTSNGYLFDSPDSTLTLYTRVFPKDTFNGSTTWSSSTTFNANQVFALLFTFMEGRSQVPIPENPVYGDLDNLTTNQKAWLNWDLFSPVFMGDEKDMTIPLVNALDNASALR